MSEDKDAAYTTLYHALVKTALLAAPFIPYMTEQLYQNLVRSRDDVADAPVTVHLCRYPVSDASRIDHQLVDEVEVVREIASLGHAVRAAESIKVKQPLSLAEIVVADAAHCDALGAHRAVIADELNVEEVAFTANAEEYVSYEVKPNFRSLGPKFGKRAPVIQKALRALDDPAGLWQSIQESGSATLTIDGESVELTADDVQVALEAKEGWAASQGKRAVVVLRTEITPALKRKGLARELQRHIQTLRKELDLAYDQRIELSIVGDGEWPSLIEEFGHAIREETLATCLESSALADGDSVTERSVDIEGDELTVRVRPV